MQQCRWAAATAAARLTAAHASPVVHLYRRTTNVLPPQVPFSWESSPGVPKNSACKKAQAMPPPPPPGRLLQPYLARNLYYGNTSVLVLISPARPNGRARP